MIFATHEFKEYNKLLESVSPISDESLLEDEQNQFMRTVTEDVVVPNLDDGKFTTVKKKEVAAGNEPKPEGDVKEAQLGCADNKMEAVANETETIKLFLPELKATIILKENTTDGAIFSDNYQPSIKVNNKLFAILNWKQILNLAVKVNTRLFGDKEKILGFLADLVNKNLSKASSAEKVLEPAFEGFTDREVSDDSPVKNSQKNAFTYGKMKEFANIFEKKYIPSDGKPKYDVDSTKNKVIVSETPIKDVPKGW